MTDYREQGYAWAGRGFKKHVDAIAARLHHSESSHLHNLDDVHGACSYCWLRAGKAVLALIEGGLLAGTTTDATDRDTWCWAVWAADGALVATGQTYSVIDDPWHAMGIGDHDPTLELEDLDPDAYRALDAQAADFHNVPGSRTRFRAGGGA